jgi:pyruvate dehydrogenase E1 component alpha subunit
MMMEIYGRHGGLCKGRGGSMHIADLDKGMLGANAIVGGGPPIALGAAIAAKIRKDKTVAVSFTGDGGSNQGTVFEAMNMAVVLKVPKIFVFENNGYGEHTGASYSVGSGDIASRAGAFGMPVFKADGFDFFSVYDAARSAVERAREGGGPSVVYAEGTRYGGHFEGDPQTYRQKGESDRLKSEKDCLMVFRNRVTSAGLLDAADLDQIDDELERLIDKSVADAKASPPPPLSELLADVYVSY